jgi:hypothetical protein
MLVKRLGVFSVAKVSGILYAVMGFIIGIIMSMASLVIGSAFQGLENAPLAAFGVLFGAGAVILLPIFYGLMGFVGGALMGWLYNIIAQYVGGIEVEFEDERRDMSAVPDPNAG